MIPVQYALRRRLMARTATTAAGTQAYGAAWNYSAASPALVRLGDAAAFSAPAPAVGTGLGSSPFDSLMPWSGMRECNIVNGIVTAYKGDSAFTRSGSNGDVMVEIPKFWYKCTNDTAASVREYWISAVEADGFSVHPAFLHNGTQQDHIYVGRYATSGSVNAQTSKSGVAHLVSLSIKVFRGTSATTGVRAKGTGWSQWDAALWSALQLLYLVEFANFNSQSAIARGYVDGNTAQLSAGATDAMTYHTGRPAGVDGKTAMQYRGIENLWGNIYAWLDGYTMTSAKGYYCLTQSKFTDAMNTVPTGYTQLAGVMPTANGYVKTLNFDPNAPWLQLPATIGGSETTYVTDSYYAPRYPAAVIGVGGYWKIGSPTGMFFWSEYNHLNITSAYFGSRLMKV